jgi:hypothetical protein
MAMIAPINTSTPVCKETVVNTATYSNVLAGNFEAVYNSSDGEYAGLLYINKGSSKVVGLIDISNKFETNINNLVYTASINGYELPNAIVRGNSKAIYGFLEAKKINLSSVYPMFEGGICFEFNHDDIYYNIKLDNDLEASFYKEQPNHTPMGWDMDFKNILQKLKSEFNVM